MRGCPLRERCHDENRIGRATAACRVIQTKRVFGVVARFRGAKNGKGIGNGYAIAVTNVGWGRVCSRFDRRDDSSINKKAKMVESCTLLVRCISI